MKNEDSRTKIEDEDDILSKQKEEYVKIKESEIKQENTNNSDDEEEEIDERTCCQKAFGKMGPGSLRGCVFNLCILSLGTGALALPQKIGYLSLSAFPFILLISGAAIYWTLTILGNMFCKYKIKNYEKLVETVIGPKWSVVLAINTCVNQFGMIILYQVILYKLLGGLIQVVFFPEYEMNDFYQNSFWATMKCKFLVSYTITTVVLLPLCSLRNISKMRYASTFGLFNLFILLLIILFECPYYIKKNVFKENNGVNFNQFTQYLKGDCKFLQSMATLFYAFSCHFGVFPVLNSLHNPTKKRVKKVFKFAVSLDLLCYVIIGLSGYFTQPFNTPDLIILRKSLFETDYLMNLGRFCFIITLISKITANYNALRECILNLLNIESSKMTQSVNFAITIPSLIFSTFVGIVFQSVSDYISLIGSFCSVFISFFIPSLIYIKENNYSILHWKNIAASIFSIVTCSFGLFSGFSTIRGIINKNK